VNPATQQKTAGSALELDEHNGCLAIITAPSNVSVEALGKGFGMRQPRVGVAPRFRVSGCFLPTKYKRRNIEAEAIDSGAMTIRASRSILREL